MSNLSLQDRKKLFSIFENIEEDKKNLPPRTKNTKILLVDGTNTFIRSHCANPALNEDGQHIGGVQGFFKSVGYAIRMLQPTRVIVAFDGKGGSQRRRALFKEYKGQRNTKVRLNRIYDDISDADMEGKNMKAQMKMIALMMQNLPMNMMAIENIEADDAIAFMSTDMFNTDETLDIIIMSSDQDFYQLINDKVRVWSPTKKRLYGKNEIFEEFGVTAQNFIHFKTLNGDNGDNIDGIKGIGLKTVKKLFPFLSEEVEYTTDDILNHARDNRNGKLKAYGNVADNELLLKRNFDLMQLQNIDISSHSKMTIQAATEKKIDRTNTFDLTRQLKDFKLFSAFPTHHIWLKDTFGELDYYTK